MNNILITGGAGFIGRNFINQLQNKYDQIFVIDNFSLGIRDQFDCKNITIIEFDLKNEFLDYEKFGKCNIDEIWHFAANSDIAAGIENDLVDLENTFFTTLNTIKIAKKTRIKKFNFASSSAIYGNWNMPLKESLGPLKPISNYGSMKLASEAALLSFSHKNKNILNIFRFPNVVGVPATHGVIFDFINKIKRNGNLDVLGNGTQKKSYLHVSELINAMQYINENNNEDSLIINLGNNDDGITVKEIAEMVTSKFKKNIKISYGKNDFGWVGDIPKFKFDTERLNNMGWSPKLSSKEAVKLAIDEIYTQLIR